jgi:hypothetical protein
VAGCRERCNECLGSIKCGVFLDEILKKCFDSCSYEVISKSIIWDE